MTNPAWKQPMDQIDFVTQKLLDKVFQGEESRRGLARHCASVAISAAQDYEEIRPPRPGPPLPEGFTPLQPATGTIENSKA